MALGEYARSLMFNGFTSLSFGYAWIDTPLAGWAPVAGVSGLGLIGYALVSMGALVAVRWSHGVRLSGGVCIAALLTASVLWGRIEWTVPSGSALRFRLIQEQADPQRKFDGSTRDARIADQAALIAAEPADLVVTSETVFPVPMSDVPASALERLRRFSDASGSHVLLGTLSLSSEGQGHNSLVHFAPRDDELVTYRKVRLMPFGEYAPLGFGWAASRMHVALNDLQPGPSVQDAFLVNDQPVGTLLCNENQASGSARAWVSRGATLLVNPSNMAWFEGSWAPAQHQQITRMRALEVARPILQTTNTGPTAAIDHRGRVVTELPAGTRGALAGTVQGRSGVTPYVRFGDAMFLSMASALVALGVWRARRRASSARSPVRPEAVETTPADEWHEP